MRQNSLQALALRACVSEPMRWYGLTFALCAGYLYLSLFATPLFPYLLGGDQLYFWMGAERILRGQVIYRDFFLYTPPGVDLVFAAFFRMFGDTIWTTNAVVLVLGVCLGCLCFSLSRQFMKNARALLATIVFLVLIYGKFLNATHHWFAVLFILLAVRVAMEPLTLIAVAFSGMFLAIASFFNQAHGAAAFLGFVAFLVLLRIRNHDVRISAVKSVATFVLSFTIGILCLYAYYLHTVGIERLWFCLGRSVIHSVGESPASLGLPDELKLSTIPRMAPYLAVYLILPSIYTFVVWECWRFRKDAAYRWNQVTLLCLVGLSLLFEVAVSVNVLRLFAIAMPGIILLVWAVGRMRYAKPVLFLCASIGVAVAGIYQIAEKHIVCNSRGQLPGGRVATSPETYERLRWLAQHTQPGDLLLQAGWPGVYLPLKVQNPLYMPTLSRWEAGYKESLMPSIQQLDTKHVRYVLWTHQLDEQCEFSTCKDYLSPVRAYLKAHFRPVHTFSSGDIFWQREEDSTFHQLAHSEGPFSAFE